MSRRRRGSGRCGRLEQLEQGAADRRLAAAALADQPQRLAALDVERHAIDRMDVAGHAREHALVDREMLLEIADLDSGDAPLAVTRAPPSRRSACQQATRWPGRCSRSGG